MAVKAVKVVALHDQIVVVWLDRQAGPDFLGRPVFSAVGDVDTPGPQNHACTEENVGIAQQSWLDDAGHLLLKGPIVPPQDVAMGRVEGGQARVTRNDNLLDAPETRRL